MKLLNSAIGLFTAVVIPLPFYSFAWNIPGHMLSGATAHQILQRESPSTIPKVRSILENHRWFAGRWRDDLAKLPESERDEMLFMLAARWADDIRTEAKLQREVVWHFINWPFKPDGEPESVKALPPQQNISGKVEKRVSKKHVWECVHQDASSHADHDRHGRLYRYRHIA